MSNQAYFDQIEQNINSLINEKRFKEAHDSCIKFLNLYPKTQQLIKLKLRIEEEVEESNQNIISEKIDEANKQYKDDKYAAAIKILAPLLEVSPNNSKIKNLIIKSQEKYKNQIERQNENFIKQATEKLNKTLKEKPDGLIEELLILEQNNPGNKLVQNIIIQYRNKLVEQKLSTRGDLMESRKYELIDQYLKDLDKIIDGNPRVAEIRNRIKLEQHGEQISEKDEFVYRSQKQLTTLVQLGKYDKAIKVANEILSVDSGNKSIKKLLNKIEDKYYMQTKDVVIDQMIEAQKNLEIQYKDKPDTIKKL